MYLGYWIISVRLCRAPRGSCYYRETNSQTHDTIYLHGMYFGTTHENSNILLRICIKTFQGYIGVVPLFWPEALLVLAIGAYSDRCSPLSQNIWRRTQVYAARVM